MTFASPMMLWSLLALLPLVAVYFLKVRPRTRPTTAYFLWEKIFHEKRSTALWHRLRNLLSLLLMALAFIAIALSMAEPRLGEADRADLLILIDNSMSMQTKEGGTTRLELAKEKATDIARALDGVQRAAVATVATRLVRKSHLSDNPSDLTNAIKEIEPSFEAFRMDALPKTGSDTDSDEPGPVGQGGDEEGNTADNDPDKESTESDAPKRRVLLITDGVLGGAEVPDGIEVIQIGGKQENLGLAAVDLQFVPGTNDRMSFYYQVASTLEKSTEVDLVLSYIDESGEEQITKVIPLDVAPGLNPPEVLSVDGAQPGRWVARIDREDALEADNTAWLVARRPPPVRVSIAAENGYFLQRSVEAFSGALGPLVLTADKPDVILAQGTSPGADGGVVFNPQGESPWWGAVGDEFVVGAPEVLVEDHPILRHLDPLSISFLGARQLTAPPGSQVLVASDNGAPLIYIASQAGKKSVVVNLDPVAGEFYYSAWFPVLVHSSAMHLAGREAPLASVYPAGQPVEIPADEDSFTAKVTAPQGEQSELTRPRIGRLDEPGFYQVTSEQKEWTLACSPLASGESLVNSQAEYEEPAKLASGGPPAGWLAIFALLAVTAESLLYHRRKVG